MDATEKFVSVVLSVAALTAIAFIGSCSYMQEQQKHEQCLALIEKGDAVGYQSRCVPR